jgi:inorganic phosphate transporter, PiT family
VTALQSLSTTVFTAVGVTYALALLFEAVNGFHDTAHAAATSIASGVFAFRPLEIRFFGRRYVLELGWTRYWIPVGIACICNFLGAYYGGQAVALFIPKIVHFTPVPLRLIMAALMAAAGWNLFTWWREIPVSSTHCLIGALTGAGIAAVGSDGVGFHELGMALAGLAAAPFIAYVLALVFAKVIKLVFGQPGTGGGFEQLLRWLQVVSSMMVSTGHGRNDGQKTMGIIAMTSAIAAGTATPQTIPHWIVLLCASCIALGTAIGAGKIIRTVGEKLSTKPLSYHDGLAAETVTAGLIHGASFIGLPLSTTQTCTCAVLGAAAGIHSGKALSWATFKKLCSGTFHDKLRRLSAFFGLPLPLESTNSGAVLLETVGWQEESIINWSTVRDMVGAWLWTFVATVVAAQVIYVVLKWLGVG